MCYFSCAAIDFVNWKRLGKMQAFPYCRLQKKYSNTIFTRNRIVKEIFNKRPKKSPTFSNAVMYYCRQRTVGKYRCVSSFIASLVSPLLRVPPSLEIS